MKPMTSHMKAAVRTVAKHMSKTALDWTDAETGGHEHDLECTNWEAYTDDARTALEEALPHVRAMIAEEIEAEDAKRHREYRAGNWENGYTSEWSKGMAGAAQIADGSKL